MHNRLRSLLVAAGLAACLSASAIAAPPGTSFAYQGLLQTGGNPVETPVDITFRLFDAAADGDQVGTDITQTLTPDQGVFTAALDFGVSAYGPNQALWLEVEVEGDLLGRQKLEATPFSMNTRGIGVREDGRVVIGSGTSYPGALEVSTDEPGLFPVMAEGLSNGGFFRASDAYGTGLTGLSGSFEGGVGVYGSANSGNEQGMDGTGVLGESYGGFGTGVQGIAWFPTGTAYGVHGATDSADGAGVFGQNGSGHGVYGLTSAAAAKAGVWGDATATSGQTFGVYGTTNSPDGRSVYGQAFDTTGVNFALMGRTYSTSGRGLYSEANATTGTTYGVYSRVFSPDGYAGYFRGGRNYFEGNVGIGIETVPAGRLYVYQPSSASSSYAIIGVTDKPAGAAVYGEATASGGLGLVGVASSTGQNYGVYGRSDSLQGFDFFADGAGMNYGASSSRRWKNSIVNIDRPLEKLGKLRGVYYNWNQDHGGQHDIGFIAEEVGEVLPEIVVYEENGIDANGMDYSKMTPLLVEAVNALRAEKDEQLAALQAENAELRDRLERIEAMLEARGN